MNNNEIMERLRGGLIVSCQALASEPLHSSYIMGRMAFAAKEGGASGIRSNSPEDIIEIRNTVEIPIIGLFKQDYTDSEVFITPTMKEIDALMNAKPDIIALDATDRIRPGGLYLSDLVRMIKKKYPDQLLMADCSCFEDGIRAAGLGFDLIGTTMSGYTTQTKGRQLPDLLLMRDFVKELKLPVIAEGGIWTVDELRQVMEVGVFAAVVGTAITRPREITRRFVNGMR